MTRPAPAPRHIGPLVCTAAALALAAPAPVRADTLYVPDHFPTLAQALAAASPGDTVKLGEGTWYEEVTIPGGVLVEGAGPARTVLHGLGDEAVVVRLSPDAGIASVAVTGGRVGLSMEVPPEEPDSEATADAVVVFGLSRAGVEASGPGTLIVQGSTIADNGIWGIYLHDGHRIEVYNSLLVANGTGMEAQGATVRALYNSVLTRSAGAGLALQGPGYWGMVANNNIVANGTAGVDIDGASTAELHNNIVAWNATGLYCASEDAANELDHNDLWANDGGDYRGLAPGAQDLAADPLFVRFDPGSQAWDDDLHLSQGSPCIDAAEDTAAWNDTDESLGDLGAYGGPWGGTVGAGVTPDQVEVLPPPDAGACGGCTAAPWGPAPPSPGWMALLGVAAARRGRVTPTRSSRVASTRCRTRRD